LPIRESTPCTEGTGSFCRVPSRGFSRTPSDSRLAHLCRIAVRAARIVPSWLFVAERFSDFQSNAVGLAARRRLSLRSELVRRPQPVQPLGGGGGILTACPSATPLGLALGPD